MLVAGIKERLERQHVVRVMELMGCDNVDMSEVRSCPCSEDDASLDAILTACDEVEAYTGAEPFIVGTTKAVRCLKMAAVLDWTIVTGTDSSKSSFDTPLIHYEGKLWGTVVYRLRPSYWRNISDEVLYIVPTNDKFIDGIQRLHMRYGKDEDWGDLADAIAFIERKVGNKGTNNPTYAEEQEQLAGWLKELVGLRYYLRF